MTDDERRKLVSTETSLSMGEEARLPTAIAGLENFSLSKDDNTGKEKELDADTFFNLPDQDDEDDDDTDDNDKR